MGDFNINIQNKNQSTVKKLCENLKKKQLMCSATTKYNQGSTFPGARGHTPLDFAVGP